MGAISKFAGQVDFTFVITRITAAANCFAQEDTLGGIAQLSAGIGLLLTINFDKLPGYDNSALADFFDEKSVKGENGLARQHLLPTPTVILDVTMWLIALLDLFNGFGPPSDGDKFRCGSAELANVSFVLESAEPDPRDWSGEKAVQYAGQNASLEQLVQQLQDIDMQMHQQIAGQSLVVLEAHRAVSLLIAGLVAARGIALGIYFCSPIPGGAQAGKLHNASADLGEGNEETAAFLNAVDTPPVGSGPAAALAFQAVVAVAALVLIAYFENFTRSHSQSVANTVESLGNRYADIAAQADKIGDFARIGGHGWRDSTVVNLHPTSDPIRGESARSEVSAGATRVVRPLRAPALTPVSAATGVVPAAEPLTLLGQKVERAYVFPGRPAPSGMVPAERVAVQRTTETINTGDAHPDLGIDVARGVPIDESVNRLEVLPESCVLDRTA